MNHNLTQEQLTERFNNACAEYVQTMKKLKSIYKEFYHLGIEICTNENHTEFFGDSKRPHPYPVHVFKGLKQIEKACGIKMENTKDYFGHKRKNEKGIDVNGVGFFQLGQATEKSFKFN